jgi:hypothetical protein
MIEAILSGLASFILFLVVHVLAFRSFELKERFRALTAIFFALAPAYAVIFYLSMPDYVVVSLNGKGIISGDTALRIARYLNFGAGLALYVFLFLGYCQFYFIVDRSISVRVMIEIEGSAKKALTEEEIKAVYSMDGILARRLQHMVEGRYIRQTDAGYANTRKGAIEARVFSAIKGLLRLGPGG